MGKVVKFGRAPAALLLGALFATLLAACATSTFTSTTTSSTQREARIDVAPEIQAFYESNGGQRILGYPLAEAFDDDGQLVQYFQRIRLEYNYVSGQVSAFALGEWALPPAGEQRLVPVPEDSPGRFFDGSGFEVQDEFLAFYEAHDGELLLGWPISAQIEEGGGRVQYFQNGRLEWHPEAPLESRVQIGLLGEAHYRQQGFFENPGRARPVPAAGLDEANVSAVVAAPILYSGQQQEIFVTVGAPDSRRPVTGMLVDLTVTHNGATEIIALGDTDAEGHAQGTISLDEIVPGRKVQVVVTVSVPGEGIVGATSLSYKTWW